MSYKYYGEVPFEEIVCPTGCGGLIESEGHTTTLVGWFGSPEEDPNHHTTSCECLNCNTRFVKHWVIKDRNAWYTQDNYCIAGKPSCCETIYLLLCPCGGWKTHSTRDKITSESNIFGYWVPMKPRYWECQNCHKKTPDHLYGDKFMDEISIDNFKKWAQENPNTSKPAIINFMINEKIGEASINLNGIKKLEFKK